MADVCFNQESSLTSTIFIQDQLKLYPFMKPMILFFKYILDQRGMNETYQGGVGSFCIAMMVLAFLQYEIRYFALALFESVEKTSREDFSVKKS